MGGSSGAGVRGTCEPPNIDAGNQTQVLSKGCYILLSTKPPLQFLYNNALNSLQNDC